MRGDDYQRVAEAIVQHYGKTRARGHTTLAMDGVRDNAGIFVCLNQSHAKFFKTRALVVGLLDLPHKLIGVNAPIAFDNAALDNLLRGLLGEINTLRADRDHHKDMAWLYNARANELGQEVHELRERVDNAKRVLDRLDF